MKTVYLNKGTELECIYDSNIIVEATGAKPLDEHSFEAVIKQHNYEQYLGQTKTYLRKEFAVTTDKKYLFTDGEKVEFTSIVDTLIAEKLLTDDIYQDVWSYLTNEMKEMVLDKPTRFGVFVKLNYVLKGYKF